MNQQWSGKLVLGGYLWRILARKRTAGLIYRSKVQN